METTTFREIAHFGRERAYQRLAYLTEIATMHIVEQEASRNNTSCLEKKGALVAARAPIANLDLFRNYQSPSIFQYGKPTPIQIITFTTEINSPSFHQVVSSTYPEPK